MPATTLSRVETSAEREPATRTSPPETAPASAAEPPAARFEVMDSGGCAESFATAADLGSAILAGRFHRTARARQLVPGRAVPADGGWMALDRLAVGQPALRAAYRPIWDTAVRYGTWGAGIGIGLKLLDTTVAIFSADDRAGVVWLVVLGSLVLSTRWMLAPALALYLSFKAGIKANFFMAALGASLVGAAFGAPIGLVVGTIVGHLRRQRAATAPDAGPEGRRPYLLGLALPLIWLALAIPGYIWFNLALVQWMNQ